MERELSTRTFFIDTREIWQWSELRYVLTVCSHIQQDKLCFQEDQVSLLPLQNLQVLSFAIGTGNTGRRVRM